MEPGNITILIPALLQKQKNGFWINLQRVTVKMMMT
jgi:hypothetical protein